MYAWSDQLTQNEVISASDHANIQPIAKLHVESAPQTKDVTQKGWLWDIWHFRDKMN
jgi:hypothetical protein